MTEALFYLSVGFVGYVAYVLVDEQRRVGISQKSAGSVAAITPSQTKPPRKTATAKKAKAVSAKKSPAASIKKTVAKPVDPTSDAILAYLGKNGITTVTKLARELPESRKMIEDSIGRLIQEGAISQTTIGRAKAVEFKG
jgi:predicted HTH transcriptional regulator